MMPLLLAVMLTASAPDRSHTRLIVAVGEATAFNGKVTNQAVLSKVLMPLLQAGKFAKVELISPDKSDYVTVEPKQARTADYVIYVSAPYKHVEKKLEGSVSVKISDARTNRSLLAVNKDVSSADPLEQTDADAAAWAQKQIFTAVDADLEAIEVNGREMHVIVSGLAAIADGQALEEAIGRVPGAKDVRIDGEEGQYDHGKQRFVLNYKGADTKLAAAIGKLKAGSRPLKVSVTEEGITAVVR
jgi:hypothetical protein